MGAGSMAERLAYARERLANAERIGQPAHIARCRQRVEGIEARQAGVSNDEG